MTSEDTETGMGRGVNSGGGDEMKNSGQRDKLCQFHETEGSWRSVPLRCSLPYVLGGLSHCTAGWNRSHHL